MAECSYGSVSLRGARPLTKPSLSSFLKESTYGKGQFLLLHLYREVRSARGLPKAVCHGLLYNVDRRVSNSRQTNKNLETTWMLISKEELNKLACSRTTAYCIRPTEILTDLHVPRRASSQRHLCQWRKDRWRQNVGRARPCWWSEVQKCPCRQMYVEDTRAHTPGCAQATPGRGNGRRNR